MLLAIDVGNSNIVIGCIRGGEISHVFRMVTDISKTEHEYAVGIKSILEFEGIDCRGFDGAIVSCVVPPLVNVMKTAVKSITGKAALIVGAGIKTGPQYSHRRPRAAGQLTLSPTAWPPSPGTSCRSSFSTWAQLPPSPSSTSAATIWAGRCVPAWRCPMSALSRGTSQLPKVPIEPPDKVVSANTIGLHEERCDLRYGVHGGRYDRQDRGGAGEEGDRRRHRRGCRAGSSHTAGTTSSTTSTCCSEVLAIIYEKNRRK